MTEAQLNTILQHITFSGFPEEGDRRVILEAIRHNPNVSEEMRNSVVFEPMGLYRNQPGVVKEKWGVERIREGIRGFSHRLLKTVEQRNIIARTTVDFTDNQNALLAQKYPGRQVSRQAEVARQGQHIYGKVIGWTATGDILIEVPTATRVKFRWVPRELMGGRRPALNAKFNFTAGEREMRQEEREGLRTALFGRGRR